MIALQSKKEMIGRRAQLIVELFLQDLKPTYITEPPPTKDVDYDYFVGFPNTNGGINNYAITVKATEKQVRPFYSIQASAYQRLAYSNLPALLLVVNVKQNRLFYAKLAPEMANIRAKNQSVAIPITEINDSVRDELLEQLTL